MKLDQYENELIEYKKKVILLNKEKRAFLEQLNEIEKSN